MYFIYGFEFFDPFRISDDLHVVRLKTFTIQRMTMKNFIVRIT